MTTDLDYLFFGDGADFWTALTDAPDAQSLDQFDFVESEGAGDPMGLAANGGGAIVLDGAGQPVEIYGLFEVFDAMPGHSEPECGANLRVDVIEDAWSDDPACFDFL